MPFLTKKTMIKKIKPSIFIILLFTACCNNLKVNVKETESDMKIIPNATETVTFMELVDKLPSLELPYTMYCGLNGSFPWIDELDKHLIGYLPEDVIVVGKVPIDNKLVYIVYGKIGDIIYPYLNIYNQNGERVDSMYLHISYCAADEEERVTTATTIDKDYSISMTDTSEYIHYLDTKTFVTDSIVVKRKNMKLMNSGFYKTILFDSLRIK